MPDKKDVLLRHSSRSNVLSGGIFSVNEYWKEFIHSSVKQFHRDMHRCMTEREREKERIIMDVINAPPRFVSSLHRQYSNQIRTTFRVLSLVHIIDRSDRPIESMRVIEKVKVSFSLASLLRSD